MDATVRNPQNTEAGVAKIALRRVELAKYRRIKGGIDTDAAFAELIRINPGQVSRVLRGDCAPGSKFIAGVLEVFGIDCFADLFELEPDADTEAAA